ncbi:MAG: A24 family peptidase [Candidatus Margulisiibacteriota bacterium]|jgi:leader peptidase (prepilin peptidase)/N-methyltransferase
MNYFILNFEFLLICLKYFLFCSGLFIIFITDLKQKIIPDLISIPLIFIGLILNLCIAFNLSALLNYSFAAIIGYLIIFSLNLVCKLYYKKDAIGLGDAKLLALIGAFTGLKAMLFTIYLSFILGGLIGLGLIVLKINKKTDYLPFGPIIIVGLILYWMVFR